MTVLIMSQSWALIDYGQSPYVAWCEGNTTLYFLSSTNELKVGDTYNGQTITEIWNGTGIMATPYNLGKSDLVFPAWNSVKDAVTNVVFDRTFKDTPVLNTSAWFYDFKKLRTITGLGNLTLIPATSDIEWPIGSGEYIAFAGDVNDLSFMFYGCSSLQNLSLQDFCPSVAWATYMRSMFEGCTNLRELDLCNFTGGNTDRMFKDCSSLKTLYIGKSWDNSDLSGQEMFAGCTNLVGQDGTTYNASKTDGTCAYAGEGGYMTFWEIYAIWCEGNSTLYYTRSHEDLNVGDIYDDQTITEIIPSASMYINHPINYMYRLSDILFLGWEISEDIINVVFDKSFKDVHVYEAYGMFAYQNNLKSITGLEYLNTDNAFNMTGMFYGCSRLTSLDLSYLNTSNVYDMSYMFSGCSALKKIYIKKKWNTANVTSSEEMFEGCVKIVGQDGTTYNKKKTDVTYAHAGKGGYLTLNYPEGYVEGDADSNGVTNTADIVEIVNYMMNRPSEKFNFVNADVNEDGVVNIADIVAISNIIMEK